MIRPSNGSSTATLVTTFSVGTAVTKITGAFGSPLPVITTAFSFRAAAIRMWIGPISVVLFFCSGYGYG